MKTLKPNIIEKEIADKTIIVLDKILLKRNFIRTNYDIEIEVYDTGIGKDYCSLLVCGDYKHYKKTESWLVLFDLIYLNKRKIKNIESISIVAGDNYLAIEESMFPLLVEKTMFKGI